MKSLNCWFKSKDDKSMFQERIPVREKETKRALNKEKDWTSGNNSQAHKKGKEREGIRTAVMISFTDLFNRGC